MRSPSRDRRYARDRGAEYRDRNRDGRGTDRNREYGSRRSRSRSRSRSRDRARPRGRDLVADGSRELREVKRILSAPDGTARQDRNADSRQSTRDSNVVPESRKKSYSEYNETERSKTDDDAKAKRGRFGESDFHGSDLKEKEKENKKDNEESKSKAEVPKEADEQYDEAALKEIESFLASTVREKKDSERGDSAKTAAAGETKGKGAAASADADEDEDDLAVVWEDEEEKAKREAAEAEERRRKRQEIASKYSAGSVPTSPVASRSSALSPGSATRKRAHTAPEPMEKATILTVESSSAGVENGSSSISVPTASIHLSKLALGSEEGSAEAEAHDAVHEPLVGSAVAAAVRAVLPAADKPAAGSSDQTAPAAVVTEQDAEGRQLEAEKSALELEERREQRGASKGYGGGYGAGGRVEFDMFSASPSGIEHQLGRKGYIGANGKYADTGVGGRRAMREALLDGEPHGVVAEGEDPLLQSNWDDGEGYYKARIGELVGDRFQILGVVGKGVFATVLKCVDLRAGDGTTNVAVKMIRNNDTMRKAAEKEKSILLSIVEHDPDNKKFCVRLLTHLEYRNHVALVFEYQSMNLRETLKKFGKDVGINIGAVRMYGRQLFVALKHLMDLRIVHADIKLDNILCSADLKQVKLCDFGSAFRETDTDNDPTPYLVSRFYRAPEIILGMQYDRAIDLWSVCTSLYELFTGHVMFPGRTNNEMLRLMMAVKGRFPNKLVKTHMRAYEVLSLEPHFDPDLRFRQYEADPITGKTVLRLIDVTNPTRDLAAVLRSSKAGADDMKVVSSFTDFLEKGLTLDPSKRMTVVDAFRHPFLSSK